MGALHRLVSICGLVMLAACGGGGSDDGGVMPPADNFAVRTAWANFLTASRTWSAAGVASNGLGYDITIGVQPGAASVMPISGIAAARSDTALRVRENGVIVSDALSETFFDAATLQLVGVRLTATGGSGVCSLASTAAVPPTTAQIGTGGTLATLDERNGCLAGSATLGTATIGWSLEFEAGTSYFCINSTEHDLGGSVLSTESDCVQVSPDGSLGARARITITQPGSGFTLTARG
ncbi:hypothetical protein [Piscinibacter sp. XHJ-5]|uniref:hypothetical protein n=1 Tax=Piscinibacter sp. XHJ-5 TaxID=3037797 RepID=UPI0024532CA1|nr:hypothetical protein [Piscinibacter sp. XHJ-5]